jgi:hypothetical protein
MPAKKSRIDDAKKQVQKQKKALKEPEPELTPDEQARKERVRKTKVDAARKKKSAETQEARDFLKKKADNPSITNQYQVNKLNANEEAIRKSFTIISTLEDEKSIVVEMRNLIVNHEWGAEYDKMADIFRLPRSLFKDLAEKYLDQDNKLQIFWLNYQNLPVVKRAMREKTDEIESLPIRKQKGPKLVFPYQDRRDKVKFRKPGSTAVIQLDDKGDVIEIPEPKPKVQKQFGEAKLSLSILPFDNWLKEQKISFMIDVKTFITPTTGTEEQKKQLENIIARSNPKNIIVNKITWYHVDEHLAEFLCRTNRIWVDESNSIMAILPDGRRIFFKIGYMTSNRTFFEQNKFHFGKERDYINTLRQTRDGEIGDILGSQISPVIEKFAIDFLSNSLSNVASGVTQYQNREKDGYIYKSVQKMIQSADGKTIKLFENLAKITVFLQNPNSIFAERIREEFYLPEILVILTNKEKLPEVFDDPNQNIDSVNDHILKQIESEVKRIATLLYKIKNTTVNVPTLPSHLIKPPYTARPWKTLCENTLESDVKNSDVFYYTDEGKVYCILISDIYKQIKEGKTPFNPITKNLINEGVIKRFKELYDFKFDRDTVVETPTPTPDKPISTVSKLPPPRQEKIPQIAPWLLKTIKKNIKGCENELRGMDLQGKDKGKKCQALDSDEYDETDDETIVQEEDLEEEDSEEEDLKEEDSEEEELKEDDLKEDDLKEDDLKENDLKKDDLFSSSSESESKSVPAKLKSELSVFGSSTSDSISTTSETDDDSDASSNSPRMVVVKEGNICQYCKKNIKKNDLKKCLKTKIRDSQDQDKTIWFCMFECFENYKFPYFKNNNKNKNKNNGKKGGRYDSRDRVVKKK